MSVARSSWHRLAFNSPMPQKNCWAQFVEPRGLSVKTGEVLTDDFSSSVTFDTLRAWIPARHDAGRSNM